MRLVAGTVAMYDAELRGDHRELAHLLGVTTIGEWPPIGGEHDADAVAFFRQTQVADPAVAGWLAHYVCLGDDLAGSAGFMGPPKDGTAEIGYSICERHRRRGLATRAVAALIERATTAGVGTLAAHVRPDNHPSIRVLEHNGFLPALPDDDEHLRFTRDLKGTSTA